MKQAFLALFLAAPFAATSALGAPFGPSAATTVGGSHSTLAARAEDPAILTSVMEAVTVYPGQAMVKRRGHAPGGGSFVFAGLPASLQAQSVRVSGGGMEVMGVEVRDRWVAAVGDTRLAAVDTELKRLHRELQGLQDEERAARELEKHYTTLMNPGSSPKLEQAADVSGPSPQAWQKSAEFLSKKLLATRHGLREIGWGIDDKEGEIAALDLERQLGSRGEGHRVFDVLVELDAAGAGGVTLEYIVLGAGWTPAYDLRAERDLSTVELTYRAEVLQQTGEDWNGVQLALSTAQPEYGAQAPELRQSWLNLYDPNSARERGLVASDGSLSADSLAFGLRESGEESLQFKKDRRAPELFDAAVFYAAVQSTGASLRYSITRPETIPSRPGTSRVLVGRSDLKVQPEHFCTPSLDEKVWLQGLTTNTSPWVMLPGSASVYFGGDYVGLASIESVRLGEEFPLHLGVDPGLTVERVALEKKTSTSGFFGSRTSVAAGWRIRLENKGATGIRKDGSVDVFVRESLPRSRDEALEIAVDFARPPLSLEDRWTRDREEKGFLTWKINVPKGSEASVEWRSKMTFPEDMELYEY